MYNSSFQQYIEAIKLAAGSVQYKDLSVKNTMIDAIRQLLVSYEITGNIKYLEIATLHIQAYLEMGFLYDEGTDIFDCILNQMGTTREIKFPSKFYISKKVKLNKSQVRSMIQRWPASPHQTIKINDLVADIIFKTSNKEMGIYYYKCAVTKDFYELIINEKENLFHDLKRGIFYTLIL